MQTVKTQMKCSIMLHFIRVYTVCTGKRIFIQKNMLYFIGVYTVCNVQVTHLRTLGMVRKARPQLSVHSVTIRITSAESVSVCIFSATYHKALSIRTQILKNIKSILADENNAVMRNARQSYVIIRIASVSHPHLNLSKPILPQSTQSFHSGNA